MLRALPLLCAVLSAAAAASPRQLAAVERFLEHPPADPRRRPPPVFVSASEPERQELSADAWPTPTPSPWLDCPTDFGLYPDPYKCSAYFQCSYGVAWEEECQPGLEYNPKAKACDFPGNIDPPCKEIPYPPGFAPLRAKDQEPAQPERETTDEIGSVHVSATAEKSVQAPRPDIKVPRGPLVPLKRFARPVKPKSGHQQQESTAKVADVHAPAMAREPVLAPIPKGPFIPLKRFARPNNPKTGAAKPAEAK